MASTTPSSSAASVTTYTIPTITSYVNLGPLPTTVKFPPDCQTDVYDFDALGIGVPWTYYTQGCALSTCCPSGHVYSTAFEWYSKYYSPAVCPYGYTPGPMDPIISTSSNENARWCCPTGFNSYSASPLATAITAPYYNWFCQNTNFNHSSIAFAYDNIYAQQFIQTESIGANYYAAYPIQIRWKEGDFHNPATITSATTSSTTPSTPSVPSLSATSTAQPITASSSSSSHQLSTGAIAAIAVVIGVLALAALAFGMFWLRKRSQRRASGIPPPTGGYAEAAGNNVYEKGSLPIYPVRHEIDSLPTTEIVHEKDSRSTVEAPGEFWGRRAELEAPSRWD